MAQANPTDVEATTYAESFILYGDKTRAFRAAFPDSKATKESQHVKAVELHNTVKVQLRLDELREGIQESFKTKALYTIEDKKRILLDAALFGTSIELANIGRGEDSTTIEKQRNPSATVAAIKELNMMDGDHSPTKSEVKGDVIHRTLNDFYDSEE